MKKLGKKFKTLRETIAAYACYCNCTGGCTCNCFAWQATNSITIGITNTAENLRSNATSSVNSISG